MFFYRKFVSVLLGCFFTMASAWSNEEDLSSRPAAIPELPTAQAVDSRDETHKDLMPVVNNDQSIETNSAYFADTFMTGFPRYFSALDITGYLRTRFNYWRNPHLLTYVPGVGGTSNFMPKLSVYDADEDGLPNPDQNHYSGNMRLRLNPTINISELTRVKTTLDIFDNLVLGTTPNYMMSRASMMSRSQDSVSTGINSWQNAIAIKRAWGEANFPIGELRFGRMPLHWGLGILYNSGDSITSDYGDQIDGVMFTTRIFDHFVTPAYSIAYTGPIGSGGAHFSGADNSISRHLRHDVGQKHALESSNMAHVFSLSFLKRDTDFIADKKRAEGKSIFNYGLFTSYRMQDMDSHYIDLSAPSTNRLIKRDGHVGMGSLWTAFTYKTFHIEAEFAGIWGKYRVGEKASDPLALNAGKSISDRDLWLLQGGLAMESKFGFLDDRLQVGLDAGLASAQEGPGFGIHEAGDNQKMPAANNFKTNFKFNPAYNVDLLLYREILGGISGTYYFKPHISYFFSRNFGLRGDAISSFAIKKSNTAGNNNLLGIELDGSAFLRTENGFYFSLAYAVLFPLKGLNHAPGTLKGSQYKTFGSAHVAQTLQFYLGLLF